MAIRSIQKHLYIQTHHLTVNELRMNSVKYILVWVIRDESVF